MFNIIVFNAKCNSSPKWWFASNKLNWLILLFILFTCDFSSIAIISATDCNSSPRTSKITCNGEPIIAEITVAVDVSFSEATWNIWIPKIKSNLIKIIDRINERNQVRVRQVFRFDEYLRTPTEKYTILPKGKDNLVREINRLGPPPSIQKCQGTNIKETLNKVLLEHSQSCSDILWVFFLFTDGYFDPDDINEIQNKMNEIKKNSEVIVIASADQYDGDMLEKFCEPKCTTNLIHLNENYEKIYEYLNELTIIKSNANLFFYPQK